MFKEKRLLELIQFKKKQNKVSAEKTNQYLHLVPVQWFT